jgi:putative component of membrane protein insertase Oxa1/YidC/SpoIIIJ protein YidD
MNEPITIQSGTDKIHLCVDANLAPSVLRAFAGRTELDESIDSLDIPNGPRWLNVAVRCLRWYRRVRPQSVSCRCVFDPSCSRYAEASYTKHGFISGTYRTLRRLNRCRPGAGGTDIP